MEKSQILARIDVLLEFLAGMPVGGQAGCEIGGGKTLTATSTPDGFTLVLSDAKPATAPAWKTRARARLAAKRAAAKAAKEAK